VDYPVTDRNVAEVAVLTGTTNMTAIVDTTQEYSTAVPGTGVFARVNENVMTGQSMNASSSVTGWVFINGYASAEITTTLNNTRQTRTDVVNAINSISHRTGVKAVDTGFDSKGVTLVATDGRNIEVRFETTANEEVFGQRIHGQGRLFEIGIIDRLGRAGAETHVKDFMIRHKKLLGLGGEDVSRLQKLKDMGL
jgi:hypothetical protein